MQTRTIAMILFIVIATGVAIGIGREIGIHAQGQSSRGFGISVGMYFE